MKKQIILVMTDTQRIDWISCYGNEKAYTPNLQRFADEGILFDRGYTCQAVCSPARSAIFTGSYPHTNGMMGNEMYLYENIKSVGQRLTDSGFKTGYIGKWHLDGGDYFGKGVCPEGWDGRYWYDMLCFLEEMSPKERKDSRKTSTMFTPDFTKESTYAYKCAEKAKQFIEEYKDEDFLLVLSFDEPHHPALCPPEYFEEYKDYIPPVTENMSDPLSGKPVMHQLWADDVKLGIPFFRAPEANVDSIRNHMACGSFVDALFGEVMDTVDEYSPDALMMYTSDHGDLAGNHRLKGKGSAMYDENVRIPFLARWKGVADPAVCHHPVSHINITPTILDYFGVQSTSYIEGKSLLPALKDPSVRINDAVVMEFNRFQITRDTFGGFQPVRAIFDGRHKLVLNLMDSDELYDLEEDPQEMVNCINYEEYQEVRNVLHDSLIEWMNDTLDPFRGYQWEARSWRPDRPATWKNTGLARQRWDEQYEKPQVDYRTGLPMNGGKIYSQY